MTHDSAISTAPGGGAAATLILKLTSAECDWLSLAVSVTAVLVSLVVGGLLIVLAVVSWLH